MKYTFQSHAVARRETVTASSEIEARKTAMMKIWKGEFPAIPSERGIGLMLVKIEK